MIDIIGGVVLAFIHIVGWNFIRRRTLHLVREIMFGIAWGLLIGGIARGLSSAGCLAFVTIMLAHLAYDTWRHYRDKDDDDDDRGGGGRRRYEFKVRLPDFSLRRPVWAPVPV